MIKRRSTSQRGFTLIELIIVIVIIAILAAVAIPKYLDLQNDAKVSAVKGMAGALGSASAANYAIRSGFPTKGVAVANCAAISGTLQGGLDPAYTITGTLPAAPGTATTCSESFSGRSRGGGVARPDFPAANVF